MSEFAIEISKLNKTYKAAGKSPEKVALHDIDLTIPKGSIFGLLGPNGAGKSTIINIMAGLVMKTSGQVKIWDVDIDQDARNSRGAIGVVPQEINYDPFFTPKQLLDIQAGLYGVPKNERRSMELLDLVGLADKADAYTRSLSGGMRRRLMVAKAMVHTPPILVLDEPTAGVDIELRRSMWDFILELNANGTTIILTTHYLEEAENLCKNIAIIDEGEIIENTSMQSLLNRLDSQTLVLDLQHEVTSLPGLTGFKARLLDRQILEVTIGREQSINQFFTHLNEAGISVSNMRNKTNRLEELFIRLVDKEQRIR